ncbi:hypothetical protein [Maribacter sp. ACAM166]|uniref:hypothetical protein n=1 Tax=Maribacter sp. ACAM166 TaxID=2508996 RepID=UPI0010FE38D0|nr:hypothetical protein [Maribacter sp. ACAM166]TLP81770.1 hypothetical protein ES765_03555 [Maribacter sp. ACAM166]
MKAIANIKNLQCEEGKNRIIRNLHRILDIRILDIDVENGMMFFLYASPIALQQVKQELQRIGYPMQSCKYPEPLSPKTYGGGQTTELASA